MTKSIQYTVRNIPPTVDAKLKAQAKRQGISLNKLLLEKISGKKSVATSKKIHRDLDWMVGVLPLEETRLVDAAIREAREADKKRAYALYESEMNK